MHLANPLALTLLLLLLPLLLARLRRPPERRRVSHLSFWKEVAAAETPAPTRRIRRDWLLLLQAALLVALVVALARPYVLSATRTVAIVIDVSMSMSARQGSTSRLDAAREAAGGRIGGLPRNSQVHVIAADAVPAVAGTFRAGDASLRQALTALAPTAAAADLAAAIDRAARLDPAPDRILVFTDVPRPAGGALVPPVEWATLGTTADNAAITLVSSRRIASDADDVQTLVEVHNYGASSMRGDVVVSREGTLLWREAVDIASGGRAVLARTIGLGSGVITATLEHPDAIALDNVRSTVVAPAARLHVRVTGRSYYVERALAAHSGLRVLTEGSPKDDLAEAGAVEVLVCDGCSSVPPGSQSVLLLPPRSSASLVAPLVPTGRALPIAKAFEGAVVPIPVDRPVADADIAARAGGLPAIVAHDDGVRRIVELRFDPDASPFSRSTGFPVLVATALDWLSMPARAPQTITAGDAWQWVLPDAPPSVSMTGPDGQDAAFTFAGSRLLARPSTAGVYHARAGGAERVFVVNPATNGESSLRTARVDTRATPPAIADERPMRVDVAGWLAALALLLLAAEWRYRWKTAARPLFPPTRATMLRCAMAAALAFAAVGLNVRTGSATMPVMFVVDRSQSVRSTEAESLEQVSRLAADMRPGDRGGLVVLGAHAAVERALGDRFAPTRISAEIDDTGTNIAAALRAAREGLPADGSGRIVLMSDGHETDGDALREAMEAAAEGVRIDVVEPVVRRSATRLPVVTRVSSAPVVRAGEPFVVTATAEGPPGTQGDIVVHADDGRTDAERVTFGADGLATVRVAAPPRPAGIYTYRASASLVGDGDAGDLDTGDAGSVVVVTGDPRLLYVGESRSLLDPALAAAGFRITHAVSARDVPRTVAALTDYDAVILDGIGAPALDTEQGAALSGYAERTGGGVLVLGGPRSLDPGVPEDDPFRRLLPVDLRPRSGRRSPSAALVVVFDKSGSMDDRVGGAQKIEIARQAVRRVLDALPATDAVGVIAFDAGTVSVAPLAAGIDPGDLAARLREVRPGGSTALAPALELARSWLSQPAAARFERRHVLLVSDGRTSDADARQAEAIATQKGFELTAVAIGRGSDRDVLTRLAAAAGGRALFPDDARQLPSILAREAARVAGGGIVEETFTPRAVPHPILGGLDAIRLPRLGGYVVGAARSSASVALTSHLDDPILATWQFGLGRVALYTADLQSPWSSDLRRSAVFGPLLVQTTRWLARSVRDDNLYATLDEEGDGVRLALDAWTPAGGYRTLLDAHVSVRTPSGEIVEAPLTESSPGRYDARLPLREPGPYVMTMTAVSRDRRFSTRLVRGFYKSAAREYRQSGVNRSFLLAMANATGGRLLGPDDSPFTGERRPEYRDARPWLLGLALALFLAETLAPAALALARVRRSGAARAWPRAQAT